MQPLAPRAPLRSFRCPPFQTQPPPTIARSAAGSRRSGLLAQIHQVRAAPASAAPVPPSTPRSAQQNATAAASGSGSKAAATLELPFPLAAPAPAALPTAAYQLAPVPAPARSGAQFRGGMNATPPEAFIPDSLRKRLDASSALATRLGSPAMFGTPDEQLGSSAGGVGGGERVFLTGAPTTLNSAFDAAAASDGAHLKPSPPPFTTGDAEDGAPTPPRGNSANGSRRTHSRGRRIVPSPMNSGLENTVKEAAVLQ